MEIETTLNQFIVDELLNGSVDVNPDDSLLADGMVDSLGMLRLVSHIEESMGFKIPHSDLVIENFRTVRVISRYIEQRMAA